MLQWNISSLLSQGMKKKAEKTYDPRQTYSLIQLARFLGKGDCNSSVLPHVAVAHLDSFFNHFFAALSSILHSSSFHCSDDVYNKLKDIIWWTSVFFEVCSEKGNPKNQLLQFFLFWHWTLKHSVEPLHEICLSQGLKLQVALDRCCENINKDIGELPPFHKLRSKLLKKLDYCQPLATLSSFQLKLRVLRQERRFEWNFLQWSKEQFCAVLNKRLDVHCEHLKILAAVEKTDFELSEFMLENLEKEVEEFFRQKEDVSNKDDFCMAKAAMKIQLLPVQDYFLGMIEANLLANIVAHLHPESLPSWLAVQSKEELRCSCMKLANSDTGRLMLSSSQLNLLLNISSFNQSQHLLPSLIYEFYKREGSRLSLRKASGLLLWHPVEDLAVGEEKSCSKLFDTKCTMSLSEMAFLLICGQSMSSLGKFHESVDLLTFNGKCQQIEVLKMILWRNSFSISTNFMSERFNKAALICIGFGALLRALGSIASVDITLSSCTEEQLSSMWDSLKLPKRHLSVMIQSRTLTMMSLMSCLVKPGLL